MDTSRPRHPRPRAPGGPPVTPFAALVRDARRTRELRLRDVAEALGVSVSLVSEVERGQRAPYDDGRIQQLAPFLGLHVDELRAHADAARSCTLRARGDLARGAVVALLAARWDALTPEQVEALYDYLETL